MLLMSDFIKSQWVEMHTILRSKNMTQPQIAESAGISQPAVSRLLANCPIRLGSAFKKLCIYAESQRKSDQSALPLPVDNTALATAIREVWNGTPEHALALAAMIRAAGQAARISMIRT